MSSPEHKQKIWSLFKDIKIGMLTTKEEGGNQLRARTMTLAQEAFDCTRHFL